MHRNASPGREFEQKSYSVIQPFSWDSFLAITGTIAASEILKNHRFNMLQCLGSGLADAFILVLPMGKNYALRHRVERTKNKHSRAVYKEGTIVIRLARGLSRTEEQVHIRDLLRSMTQQILEDQDKILIDPFKKMLDGAENITVTLVSGKKYAFNLRPGARTSARRTARGWNVTIAPGIRRKGLHRILWRILSHAEQKRIQELIVLTNEQTYGVHISQVKLRFAQTQWGSCSPRGVIMINSALLFAPPSILRYVIIHELAHRKRADHSAQYWQWVAWALPHYKKLRKELQEYRLPTL